MLCLVPGGGSFPSLAKIAESLAGLTAEYESERMAGSMYADTASDKTMLSV
jgi:hypothetical protein